MGILKRNGKAPTSVVGLDIDPGHLAVAEVHVNGSLVVTRDAVAPLRPGIVRDGEVTDGAALTEALRALWAEHTLPKRVRVGIASQRIVVRTIDLPPLDDERAIASAVRVEAPDHIPMPIDEAVLDYQPLGIVETPTGPKTRVVVVAVRRETVERYAHAIRGAGLTIEGVDLSAFALVRAMAGKTAADEAVLLVYAAGLTNVAVARGGACVFTRAAAGGLDSLVRMLAERRGLTQEHAEQWIKHVGLERPAAEIEGDPEVVEATRAVLEEGVHQLADTVRNSLNFYRTQPNAETVRSAVLAGPATQVPGFAAALAKTLGMPVDVGTVAHGDAVADPSRVAIAAGLAVESVD